MRESWDRTTRERTEASPPRSQIEIGVSIYPLIQPILGIVVNQHHFRKAIQLDGSEILRHRVRQLPKSILAGGAEGNFQAGFHRLAHVLVCAWSAFDA